MDKTDSQVKSPHKFTGLQYMIQRPSVIREVKKETLREIKGEIVHKEEIRALQTQIDSLIRTLASLQILPQRIEELEEEVRKLKLISLQEDWHKVEIEEK